MAKQRSQSYDPTKHQGGGVDKFTTRVTNWRQHRREFKFYDLKDGRLNLNKNTQTTIYFQNYDVTADNPIKLDTMAKELFRVG